MVITFERGHLSTRQRKLMCEAAELFAGILMDPRMVRNIQLDINIDNNLDVMGECICEDDTRNPRWFTINLRNKRDDDDMIKTLAHELVHVKQYAKNQLAKCLTVSKNGKCAVATKWNGEIWKAKKREDDYFDSPWEVEAYGREVGMYHRWVKHYNEKYGKKGKK